MLPSSFQRAIEGQQKYIANSFWIMGERVAGLALSFLATIFVARYLGPTDFGVLAYVLSLTALFASAGHMGLSGLVVREIVRDPEGANQILGTACGLKLIGMAVGYAVIVAYAFFYEGPDSLAFSMLVVAGAALLFRPLEVVDFWFQAHVRVKYSSIAKTVSAFALAMGKLLLVLFGAGLVYFATAQLLHAVLTAILFALLFKIKAGQGLSVWRFSRARARALLQQGWPIYLGSIFAAIYLKVDQVMLRWLTDVEVVGQYAAASQLSVVWYFVPTAIVASFFPKLIKIREHDEIIFKELVQRLLDSLFLLGISVAVITTFLAPFLVLLLFGEAYAPSSDILVVHVWASVFIFMRAVFSKWILVEGLLMFSLITQGMGALANVLLNLMLIPEFSGVGAAYATLVSYAIASYFALLLFSHTRPVFWQMTLAMFSPARYSIRLSRGREKWEVK